MQKLLSNIYCETLVLFGLVLPLSEVLVKDSQKADLLQGYHLVYYVFLCTGGLLYLIWMYATMVKDRTVVNIVKSYRGDEETYNILKRRFRGPINRYGSFYLRLGAIAFGVGSMVYTCLELGNAFEKYKTDCGHLSLAVPPAFRLALTIAQMQFIFLNNQNMDLYSKPMLSRFGLMHLVAVNLCEWLNVIIQETKHEIEHSSHIKINVSAQEFFNDTNCTNEAMMSSVINNFSHFLFPCTIEYSLICAVIMVDMWLDVKKLPNKDIIAKLYPSNRMKANKASHIFTVDCANSHKGLLCGLIVLVLTVICQTLYFFYKNDHDEAAQLSIDVCEMVLYILASLATVSASIQFRSARTSESIAAYNMDSCLILMAQFGVSLYSIFRLIGLSLVEAETTAGLCIETASLVQSLSQTVFIVHGQSLSIHTSDSRPARQLITFLLPCNIALWTINTLVKNRASSDELLINLFNQWAWTTVTRIAMPLSIFYRFHSTICLFEMWKNAYKRSSHLVHHVDD
ncbi:Otopetrin [Nesidiocoris tenuis]|uniref:Otopetrin n=1 Tax=Nesidiocoris tenuis TaxID=355587 RepID=A0ABN7ACS3_9HEMI|nr:Otopetrin [Nesidiocoris tenuis]